MDSSIKNSILVVDDERLNLEVLNSILSPEYTVYMTKSGSSAIKMAQKYFPDLVLLDIIMPDMSGYEVLKELKSSEQTKHIPVIIITGLNRVEDEEEGMTFEAADFIHKPFSSRIVKTRVRNQLQIVNQIRELAELHKNMEAAVNAADTANRAKSSFLARISHEIRTPLNAVLGISEIHLQDESLKQETKEAFSRIYNCGDLLLNIINDILDMSIIEAGKPELAPLEYDVSSLIKDIVFFNMIKYENKPVEFLLNIDENIPSKLFGDELRIKQVLNNLLSNAFKYTNAGEVELIIKAETVQKPADSVMLVLSVRDTGQGMTDECSRFNAEANRTTEGIGLGMAITQNLINIMNGDISVESEFGKGSVFTVRLLQGKTNADALGKEAAEKLRQFRMNFQTKKAPIVREQIPFGKVLIVDDMDMILFVVKEKIAKYGLIVDTASGGQEAIEKIKNNEYSIVFMDHLMPGMDGIETTLKIRQLGAKYEKLPVIALTANTDCDINKTLLDNGFNGYIIKPVVTEEMDKIIKEFITN